MRMLNQQSIKNFIYLFLFCSCREAYPLHDWTYGLCHWARHWSTRPISPFWRWNHVVFLNYGKVIISIPFPSLPLPSSQVMMVLCGFGTWTPRNASKKWVALTENVSMSPFAKLPAIPLNHSLPVLVLMALQRSTLREKIFLFPFYLNYC